MLQSSIPWFARALVLVAALASSNALAQDTGRDAYLAADFPAAAAAFERALAGEPSREAALEAHRHLATLRFVLGDPNAARGHAAAAITLDPNAEPPEGSPFEVNALFEEASRALGAQDALELSIEPQPDGGAEVSASLRLWPSALDGMLRVQCAANDAPLQASARPPRVRLQLPSLQLEQHCVAELGPAETTIAWLQVERRLDASSTPLALEASSDEMWPWVLVGAGVALVVAAAIVVALLLAPSGTQDARFEPDVRVPGW